MQRYILRRLLLFIPTVIGVSVLIFMLVRLNSDAVAYALLQAEGNVPTLLEVERVKNELGLNEPIYVQYAKWIGNIARLEFGTSFYTRKPVVDEITRRLPITLQLGLMTTAFAILIAVPLGVLSAIKQDKWVDYVLRVVTIGGLALPSFWVGTLILMFLVIWFGWSPPLASVSLFTDPLENMKQLIWPSVALGWASSAAMSRMTRSAMLEVLRQDYVRTAWAKGLGARAVITRHAMKNALLPVVTIMGLQFANLLGGTVIMERIFSVPGMGLNLVDSITRRDYPMVQMVVLIFALFTVFVNLLVDLTYAWLDPRIRY